MVGAALVGCFVFFLSTNLKLGGEMDTSGIDCLLLIRIFLAYFDFTYYWYVLYLLLSDVILLLLCYLCNY